MRVWLTYETARALRLRVADLSPTALADFIGAGLERISRDKQVPQSAFHPEAQDILVPEDAYRRLRADERSVSDEHAFRLLIEAMT